MRTFEYVSFEGHPLDNNLSVVLPKQIYNQILNYFFTIILKKLSITVLS